RPGRGLVGLFRHAPGGDRGWSRRSGVTARGHRPGARRHPREGASMTEAAQSREFENLLQYLERTRGFDFGAYKQPSLIRRVQKRMHTVGIDRFSDYTDYLEVHPDEFARLFDVILVNVTGFFRDESSWDYVRDEVLPVLLAM